MALTPILSLCVAHDKLFGKLVNYFAGIFIVVRALPSFRRVEYRRKMKRKRFQGRRAKLLSLSFKQ